LAHSALQVGAGYRENVLTADTDTATLGRNSGDKSGEAVWKRWIWKQAFVCRAPSVVYSQRGRSSWI